MCFDGLGILQRQIGHCFSSLLYEIYFPAEHSLGDIASSCCTALVVRNSVILSHILILVSPALYILNRISTYDFSTNLLVKAKVIALGYMDSNTLTESMKSNAMGIFCIHQQPQCPYMIHCNEATPRTIFLLVVQSLMYFLFCFEQLVCDNEQIYWFTVLVVFFTIFLLKKNAIRTIHLVYNAVVDTSTVS